MDVGNNGITHRRGPPPLKFINIFKLAGKRRIDKKEKDGRLKPAAFFNKGVALTRDDRLVRALARARAAIDTLVGIDGEKGRALIDRFDRAGVFAKPARNTFVRDLISHDDLLRCPSGTHIRHMCSAHTNRVNE
jgi:hypothetical protein